MLRFSSEDNGRTATLPVLITTVVALVLAVYRPFCQFICPFGFISWLAERFSLMRVRVNPNVCNKCGACALVCPLEAAEDTVEGRLFAADCYSCARCLNVCPKMRLPIVVPSDVRQAHSELADHGRGRLSWASASPTR